MAVVVHIIPPEFYPELSAVPDGSAGIL